MEGSSLGANLLRDVFAAADGVHENAMSEMDDNTLMNEEVRPQGGGNPAGEASTSRSAEPSGEPLDSMEVQEGGESAH